MIGHKTISATAAALALTMGAAHADGYARLVNTQGDPVGEVLINETPSGLVHIRVAVGGLQPGPHGFHLHQTGECNAENDFESAGGHIAGDMEHGIGVEGGPHPGDLPNIHAGQDGVVRAEFFTDRIALEGDGPSIFDEDGTAVMVHANADDYESQPSGAAGARVACGVVERQEQAGQPVQSDEQTTR